MLGPDIDPPGDPINDCKRERDGDFDCVPEPAGGNEAGEMPPLSDDIGLGELVTQLESDPGECERAIEGLQVIDEPVRVQIVEQLAKISSGPGVFRLLRLLASAGLGPTSEAAARALDERELRALNERELRELGKPMVPAGVREIADAEDGNQTLVKQFGKPEDAGALVLAEDRHRPRIVHSAVTAVDGEGRGSIGLSVSRSGRRCSAVFLCDVMQGVVDARGQFEEKPADAGWLLRDFSARAGRFALDDVPELALGLLAGSLTLSRPFASAAVSDWLERTVGPGLQLFPLPAASAEPELESVPSSDLMHHSIMVLSACPSWLDTSRLTFEMAEEVYLREGSVAADPRRDAGAFRFLFEHRIIHRLELYRRMLLWMAWFWQFAHEAELARSARIVARGLMDEQFAVPSHPFAVALMARSLDAAREKLGTQEDPRKGPGEV